MVRKQLIIDYSKGLLTGKTWPQIEKEYNIESSSPGDRARKWVKWYTKTGQYINQWAPGESFEAESVSELSPENKLTLKSTWQQQSKEGVIWLSSYQNNVTPQDIKQFRSELIDDISSFAPKRSFKYTPTYGEYAHLALISIPDFHVGRDTIEVSREKYLGIIDSLLSGSSNYLLDQIVYVIGNDFFNSDHGEKTTKGTQQFDKQTWWEMWKFGKDLLIESIEMLKQKKVPIHVVNVPGNHDEHTMFHMGDVIESYYRNDDQIIVDNSHRLIKSFLYGETLLGFEHGELKPAEYPYILASEFPELWGKSKYREFLVGHLHHEIVKQHNGNFKLRFLPSLASNSEWESKMGFKTSKEAQALIYSKNRGVKNIIVESIE